MLKHEYIHTDFIEVIFSLQQSIENGRNMVALSCSIKLVNAIVSAEKRETPITDVSWSIILTQSYTVVPLLKDPSHKRPSPVTDHYYLAQMHLPYIL